MADDSGTMALATISYLKSAVQALDDYRLGGGVDKTSAALVRDELVKAIRSVDRFGEVQGWRKEFPGMLRSIDQL